MGVEAIMSILIICIRAHWYQLGTFHFISLQLILISYMNVVMVVLVILQIFSYIFLFFLDIFLNFIYSVTQCKNDKQRPNRGKLATNVYHNYSFIGVCKIAAFCPLVTITVTPVLFFLSQLHTSIKR